MWGKNGSWGGKNQRNNNATSMQILGHEAQARCPGRKKELFRKNGDSQKSIIIRGFGPQTEEH